MKKIKIALASIAVLAVMFFAFSAFRTDTTSKKTPVVEAKKVPFDIVTYEYQGGGLSTPGNWEIVPAADCGDNDDLGEYCTATFDRSLVSISQVATFAGSHSLTGEAKNFSEAVNGQNVDFVQRTP